MTTLVPDTGDASATIARVLKAEHDAREAVASCEKAAQELLGQARVHAREIGARADARCARLKSKLAAGTAAAVARLDAEAPVDEPPSAPEADGRQRLEAAVAALAAELTTEPP